MIAYHLYSQRDPRWRNMFIGHSRSTMGRYGCLVTSIAMMVGVTPIEANRRLTQAGLIGYPTCMACLNSFSLRRAFPYVAALHLSPRWSDPVPSQELERLRSHLAVGGPAIIEVDINTRTLPLDQHFVLGVGIEDESIIIHDPWDGMRRTLVPTYGKDEAIAVWRFVLYRIGSDRRA